MPWLGRSAAACTAPAAPLPGVVSERMRRFARMNSFKKEARRVGAGRGDGSDGIGGLRARGGAGACRWEETALNSPSVQFARAYFPGPHDLHSSLPLEPRLVNPIPPFSRQVVAGLMRAEEVAGLMAQFQALDADRDGKLSVQELAAGLGRQELRGPSVSGPAAKPMLDERELRRLVER